MKKVIATTTIYPYDEIIERYDNMDGWTLIVSGDKKTPSDFKLKNGIYLSYEDQEKLDPKLSELIGPNSIQRRNFSFLMAHKLNADIIATIDSDNAPLSNWGKNTYVGEELQFRFCRCEHPVFDPLYVTDARKFWHRGFPIQLVKSRSYSLDLPYPHMKVDIAAFLWNGDLDVSALQRCIWSTNHTFGPQNFFPFTSDKFSPFNSQNTVISKNVLPHYFMIPHVGRMDDIWPSYYVQSLGFKVGYFEPTVYQDRHIHDNTKDMVNEFLDQEDTLKLAKDLYKDPSTLFKYIPGRSAEAFRQYQRNFE